MYGADCLSHCSLCRLKWTGRPPLDPKFDFVFVPCGGLRQGWESECGRVEGIPLIENEKELSIVEVPLLQLKPPRFPFHVFLKDIVPIFKIFKNL